ncbi:hypothetical protein K435DRAFT_441382 [Dendrothele bispora CBS 962.96]|uniref:Uncharacterized protein n=1 Tax=Dendrothele bispora (strain CBS 962.96) TaxID=1314807 RepID=A0A4S8L2W0_DENBC|nr:hypothetical protein K435DRAFT_441382 [Dendrothele bispora CBS 962.96]
MSISILKHKRAHLEGSVTLYRSLLSPIRRLPREILTLVFFFLCGESDEWLDSFRQKLLAFKLSWVCASWRELALTTPTIWGNVVFDLDKNFFKQQTDSAEEEEEEEESIKPAESFIRLYLQRSSQVPLDLVLWRVGANVRHGVDRHAILDGMLRPASHRWRSLVLRDCRNGETLWSQITDLTSLEYLRVTIEDLMLALDASPALRQTPRLRSLQLSLESRSEVPISTAPLQAFPWAQLITLKLTSMDSPRYFNVLRGCVHLTKLELIMYTYDYSLSHDDPPSDDGTDVVTLDHLNDLKFGTEDFGYELRPLLVEGFSRMTTPALKHLTISCSKPDMEWSSDPECIDHKSYTCWPLDVFSKFAQRSGCTLTSLCIDSPITASECLSLLRIFPDLRELDIREPFSSPRGPDFPWKTITDDFLKGLRTTHTTDSLFKDRTTIPWVPRLLHLSLHVTKPTFRPGTLNEMVRSRWIPDPAFSSEIGVACLRSIKLIGDERAAEEPSPYNSLMKLEKFGLRVEIF